MGRFGRKNEGQGKDEPVGGHDKNKRPSSQEKHQRGDERRGRDQGGEKGDARRKPNPNKRDKGNGRG